MSAIKRPGLFPNVLQPGGDTGLKNTTFGSKTLEDSLFLTTVVLLSVVLYIGGLGFYSTDWSLLGNMSLSPEQSITGVFRYVYHGQFEMRPVKILYLATLYRLFGTNPLGYHLANTVVFLAITLLFYRILRLIKLPRILCLAMPLAYALLPNFSTVHFWPHSFTASLSMALYFLSLYADLRALPAQAFRFWGWKLLSILCIIVSVLAYEIVLPLFFLNPLLVRYRWRLLDPENANERRPYSLFLLSKLLIRSKLDAPVPEQKNGSQPAREYFANYRYGRSLSFKKVFRANKRFFRTLLSYLSRGQKLEFPEHGRHRGNGALAFNQLFLLNMRYLLKPLQPLYRKTLRNLSDDDVRQNGPVKFTDLARSDPVVLFGINLLILAPLAVFKALTTTRPVMQGNVFHYLSWLALRFFSIESNEYDWGLNLFQMIGVSYGTYGIGLPLTVWEILQNYFSLKIFMLAGVLGVAIHIYFRKVFDESGKADFLNKKSMATLIKWGLLVFGLGYIIFITNWGVQFTPTGMANRTAIAAAIGVALSLVGGMGYACNFFRSEQSRRFFFSMLVAFFCASGFLVTNTLAAFWTKAFARQTQILTDIRRQIASLPPKSTLLLDGVCPYEGPAPVFDSDWDFAGALLLLYKDYTLRANIVTLEFVAREDGIYPSLSRGDHYPYENLFIYNFRNRKLYKLQNAQEAQRYFQTFNDANSCPPGYFGHGVKVF